ncbi:hypothetical protein R3P38DRAFT_3164959 [Favolaschia claudopus]|uniref:Uncharacterized protein n=1 Tax=Favolaschia claudopus TaxID=2862362 RepID=A0AAW0EEH0_9AGAR
MSEDSSSPAYAVQLRRLYAKATKTFAALPPDASPGTKAERRAIHEETNQIFKDIAQMLELPDDSESNEDETLVADEPEPPQDAPADPVEARAATIIPPPGTCGSRFLNAEDFRASLSAKAIGKRDELEDAAFRRLFAGYTDSEDNWVRILPQLIISGQRSVQAAALEPLLRARTPWGTLCEESIANDSIEDPCTRLLKTHKELALKAEMDNSVFFVDYVLRQIQILKFVILWTAHDDQRKWKTDYLNAAFELDFRQLHEERNRAPVDSQLRADKTVTLKTQMARYKKDYARVIKQRRDVLALYRKFGPGIFLDMYWDTVNPEGPSVSVKRSTTFGKLCEYVCSHLPYSPPPYENCELPMITHADNADSLYNILHILTDSTTVPEFVANFMRENPPDINNENWRWGRAVRASSDDEDEDE